MNSKILIVDDEEDLLETCRLVLQPMELEILTTTSPLEAIEHLRHKNIDLLITDLKMPEMDGIELIKQSKALSPDTEVIVFTAYATIETAVEAIKLGAFNYIQKPFSKIQLIELTKKALEKKNLITEYNRLKSSFKEIVFTDIIFQDERMKKVMDLAEKVARSSVNVLITGESGTGKERLAKWIHQKSDRRDAPFVVVDMNTITETIAESELFGYKKGAFTGATEDRKGILESANNGTLFIDEIGDINKTVQSKLLRVIEEKTIRRVGSNKEILLNLRIISATNKDILQLVKEGKFREDLFYRLNVVHIQIPPLRERRSDIPLLVDYFIKGFNKIHSKNIRGITDGAIKKLMEYPWYGNVRELKNIIEKMVVLSDKEIIDEGSIQLETNSINLIDEIIGNKRKEILQQVDYEYIQKLVEKNNGNITAAAREAGVTRATIYRVLKKNK